jgi:ribonuclease E
MLNTNTPAGNASGPSPTTTQQEQNQQRRDPAPAETQATFELPAKLRVHALAKNLGASSREIITALEELGESVRSAQSNITREAALRVVRKLRPEQLEASEPEPAGSAESAEAAEASESAEPAEAGASRAGLAPVFAAPQAMFLAPEPATARSESQARSESPTAAKTPAATETTASAPRREEERQQEEPKADSDEDDQASRRRRRRGRRGRGRGRGSDGEQVEAPTDEQSAPSEKAGRVVKKDTPAEAPEVEETETESSAEEESGESGTSRRRRRRRRRKGNAEDEAAARADDPPNTVVHVRETAPDSDDEVRAVKGSTRLEAKRQRRRDGREAGRRRAPVLSESEFLARRESVDRKMVVRENGDQTQIAVLEDNVLVENFVTSSGSGSLVGNVYLGRVQNVLPSMEAAFVDIGRGRNAVLYAGEVDWDAAGLAGKARRIEQALSTGDSVLVQVTKDPVGHKGARLTTQISLPGRFLVYVPGGGATGISRKLPDNERKRLKEILKRIVPDNAGVIIRTASEGTSEQALERDVRRLQAQWDVIREKAEAPKAQAPQLLYEEPDLLIKVVRDLFTEDFSSLTVQGADASETIEAYVRHVAPDLMSRLHKHVGKTDVFTEQRISEQIAKALDRKVWLPSGGYLVVDRTEAMTVIDVNTGKFTGSGGNLEETVTRNNLEAAEEIVRQLRLRDIGGIIVIDFIDMVLESNRDLVLRRLTECLGRDRTRHQVAEVTSLGLVQMTRKRVGTGLLEAYSSSCEHCRGRGLVVSTEPVTHARPSGNAGNGGGSRRSRHRGKPAAPEAPTEVAETESAERSRDEVEPTPVAAEPVSAQPHGGEQAEPTVQPTPAEPVAAELEPEPAAPAESGGAEPAEPSTAVAAGEPVGEQAVDAAVPPEASDGRPKRRKVSRPAGSAGEAPASVVVTAPAQSAADQSSSNGVPTVPEPATATVTRRPRKAVSRPAGPPVDTPAEASDTPAEASEEVRTETATEA